MGELENRWQIEYRERIMGRNATHERGYFALLRQLSLELHTLQDEFVNRPIGKSRYLNLSVNFTELLRSHTPTTTDLHSDNSGSAQSVHRLSYSSRPFAETRRLSISAVHKFARPFAFTKGSTCGVLLALIEQLFLCIFQAVNHRQISHRSMKV
jgi:hypothetical protein